MLEPQNFKNLFILTTLFSGVGYVTFELYKFYLNMGELIENCEKLNQSAVEMQELIEEEKTKIKET